ncbi:glycosyltransferase family 4 protein [Geofilum rubicundum]|uniref:Glycosyltransferase, group 1 family protein n=1 Tax=Geofilum rubicundum JCM 15548 TaxID=1236989 RepID=A0A0E9LTB0_9BACT|nr:glycosyltransferase family 4 protein [Geofilum rubicundum]GAO28528.1 glycosyltransferase, group 1 family protein [Geofilum rubicundum JCM 15548]
MSNGKKQTLFVGPFGPPFNGDGVKNSYLREGFEEVGIKGILWFDTIARNQPRWKNNLKLIRLMVRAHQIIFSLNRNGRYYIIPIFWLLSLFSNKKGVLYVVGGSFDKQMMNSLTPWKRRIFVKMLNKLDGVFAESIALKEGLEKCGLKNVVLVYNPRKDDGSQWQLNERIKRKGVFVSRVTATKGVLVLLEAIVNLNKSGSNLELDIYGPMDAAHEKEVSCWINEAQGQIRYRGILDPTMVQSVLTNYHFLALPTFHSGEGLPGILVEAGMAGIPIVITRFNALPEYFKHNESALFVEPKDVDGLEQAVLRLVGDDHLANTLSNGIKNVVVPFHLESIIQQSLQLLDDYNWKI